MSDYSVQTASTPVDIGGFKWGLLGFFVPVAGLVLYLVWKDFKPKTAKAAGIGALVSLIVGILIWILYIIILVGYFAIAG